MASTQNRREEDDLFFCMILVVYVGHGIFIRYHHSSFGFLRISFWEDDHVLSSQSEG